MSDEITIVETISASEVVVIPAALASVVVAVPAPDPPIVVVTGNAPGAMGVAGTTIVGMLKGDGLTIVEAVAGTDYVAPNTVIVAGTGTKVTYDAKGLVTSSTSATTADIADSTDKRYCTDAQKVVIGNTSNTNTGDVTIGTANGLSLVGQALSLQVATNSVPGALSAADHTTFAAKEPAITAGTSAQYFRGDKSLSTFATDALAAAPAETVTTIKAALGITTLSGSNTGDQTGGTPAITLGTANTAGTAATFIRTDDTVLAFDTTAPSTQAFSDSAATGSATVAARRDHKHAMMATPTSVSGNAGTATTLATARAINGTDFNGSTAITVPVNNANDATTDADVYLLWTATQAGNYAAKTSVGLKYHPSTGALTIPGYFTAPNHVDAHIYTDLNAAVTAIGATPTTLYYGTNVTVSANIVIPTTLELIPVNGALIQHSTYTISYAGPVERWPSVQIFNGTGEISGLDKVVAEWWGAKADNSTDNYAALNIALQTAYRLGSPLILNRGIYLCSHEIALSDASTLGGHWVHLVVRGKGCPDLLLDGNPSATRVGGTVIQFTNTDGTHGITLIPTLASSHRYPAVSFNNIEFRGSGNSSGNGLHFVSPLAIRLALTNISVNTFGGGTGIHADNCENGGCSNVATNRNSIGMKLLNAANANQWFNFVAQNNKEYGLHIHDCTTNSFFGGLIQNNEKTGVYINGTDEVQFYGVHFEGNNSTNTALKHGVHIQGTSGYSNNSLFFQGCRFAGTYDDIYMEGVSGGTNAYTTFYNCRSALATGLVIADQYNIYTNVDRLGTGITDNGTLTRTEAWRVWTPSFSGAVLGGYTTARYKISGTTLSYNFAADDVTVTGAGIVTISLPAASGAEAGYSMPNSMVNDGSAWIGPVTLNHPQGSSSLQVWKSAAAASWVGDETGVHIRLTGQYELDLQ